MAEKTAKPVQASSPEQGLRNRDAKAPGKSTQPYTSGNDFIDKGAVCDANPEWETCFLDHGQRHRMIEQLEDTFVDAGNSFKGAVEALRVDTLLKKDDDLGWVRNLVLDTLVGRFMTTLSAGLAAARGVVGTGTWVSAARARIDSRVKSVVDASKKKLAHQAKTSQNTPQTNAKDGKIDYLAFLSDQAHRSFAQLRTDVPGEATDAELVWLFESFKDPASYSPSTFKAALAEKLMRYQNAQVGNIGQTWQEAGAVSRHTRVVALHFTSGHPTEYWLEKSEMGAANMDGADMRGDRFEHRAPKTAQPELISRVPDEFLEAALARQANVWGNAAMGFRQIDESAHDPMIYGPERWQRAKDKHSRDRSPAPVPKPITAQAAQSSQPAQPMASTQPTFDSKDPQPTSFGAKDPEPIIPPTGPFGFNSFGDS